MKINEKIANAFKEDPTNKKTFYSFEYFPARTEAGIDNLIDRIERMGQQNPLWIDVTWSAGGRSSDITLELCNHLQNFTGLDVLMHLTCTFMTREKIIEALDTCKKVGIRNILALRGDPPIGATGWVHQENGFNHAIDLVRFIKENYGDHFCIVVAGYPETHPDAPSPEADIQHLKEKCEAGADIVITQLFFEVPVFNDWVKRCREAGITAHLLPGIMPILGYDKFMKMQKFTNTKVPQYVWDKLEELKQDDEAVRKFGVEVGVQMGKELIESGTRILHWYTMNLEKSVIEIINKLGIVDA